MNKMRGRRRSGTKPVGRLHPAKAVVTVMLVAKTFKFRERRQNGSKKQQHSHEATPVT